MARSFGAESLGADGFAVRGPVSAAPSIGCALVELGSNQLGWTSAPVALNSDLTLKANKSGDTFTGDVVINRTWLGTPTEDFNCIKVGRYQSGSNATVNSPIAWYEHIADAAYPYCGFVLKHGLNPSIVDGRNPGGSYISMIGPQHSFALQFDYLAAVGTPNYQGDVGYNLTGPNSKHIFRVNNGTEVGRFDANGLAVGNRFVLSPSAPPVARGVAHIYSTASAISSSALVVENTAAATGGWIQAINDAGSFLHFTQNGSAAGNGFLSAINDGGRVQSTGAGGLALLASNAAGAIRFGTGSAALVNERMRINSAGRVLIGPVSTMTDDGARTLQVGGAATFAGAIFGGGGGSQSAPSLKLGAFNSGWYENNASIYGLYNGTTVYSMDSSNLNLLSTLSLGWVTGSPNATVADVKLVRASATLFDVRANGGMRVRDLNNTVDAPFVSGPITTPSIGSGTGSGNARLVFSGTSTEVWNGNLTGYATIRVDNVAFNASRSRIYSSADGFIELRNNANTANSALTTNRLRVATGIPSQPIGFFNYGDLQLIVPSGSPACFSITQDNIGTGHFGLAASNNSFVLGCDGAAISFRQNPTSSMAGGTERLRLTLADATLTQGSNDARWTIPATGQRNSQVGNGSGTWQTGYREQYDVGGVRCGFYGATPVAQQSIAAAATDPATTQTLANSLRTAMLNLGLGV